MNSTSVEQSVAGLAATACVRVLDPAGDVVGSGFLIGPDLVATCAHVVADALGADPHASTAPRLPVEIEFPVLPGEPVAMSATVHRWVPIAADGTGDVALLRLERSAPPDAVMPPLRRVDRLWGHPYRVFGFPDGRWDGVWTTGTIRGRQATGWFQLQGTAGDQPIEGGFSGAPVWDGYTGAVVGMTVAADRDRTVSTAYLLPVEQVLGLDPELLPNPYRGLEPFGEEHADYFFGRGPEIDRLAAAVGEHRIVAVTGPSGVGKSSLVRAGLLPRLRATGARVDVLRPKPGSTAIAAVGEVVAALLGVDDAAEDPRVAATAAELIGPATREEAAARSAAGVDRVLVVDQFEELADADPGTARVLLGVLTALAAAAGSAVRVVLTVRGSALDEVLAPASAALLTAVLIGPLDRARLREAVVGPAGRAPGLAFEDGLVDRILDDAGSEPGRLPLIESLLTRLWAAREGGSLTLRGYQAAGGVVGALAAHAEQVAATVRGPDGNDAALRDLCTRLAVARADGFVRRPVALSDLPAERYELVAVLAAARLVVTSGSQRGGTVELAHQALVDHWPRLREWLAADREFLRGRAELDAARQRWVAADHDDGALLRGGALESAGRWAEERPGDLAADQLDYVRRSRARRRREVRRWRTAAAVLAVLALAAGTLAVVATVQNREISRQLAAVNADLLADESTARLARDPVLAAEISVAAWRSDPDRASARTALAEAYLALDGVDAALPVRDGQQVFAAAVAGNLLVTVNMDGVISLTTDVLGPAPTPWVVPEPTGIEFIAADREGSRILVVAGDGAVRMWPTGADRGAVELAGAAERARQPTFSADGSRVGWVAPTPAGEVLRIRDLGSGATTTTALPPGTDQIQPLADPDLVVVRSSIGTAVLAVSTGATVRVLSENSWLVAGLEVGCVDPADSAAPAELVVRDLLSGAELRRVLLRTLSCRSSFTPIGRYVLERLPDEVGATTEPIRVIDPTSGSVFQFRAPTFDPVVWQSPGDTRPPIDVLPTGDGGVAALVAVASTVLRIPAELEPPMGSLSYVRPVTGGLLVVDRGSATRFATYDAATGQPIGEIRDATTANHGWTADSGDLWALAAEAAGWQLTSYSLPRLELRYQAVVPVDPQTTPIEIASEDGTPLVAFADGMLTRFDPGTGRQLGPALRIPDVTRKSLLRLRPGHPDQAVVTTEGGVELWDLVAGRRLSRGELTPDGPVAHSEEPSLTVVGDALVTKNTAEVVEHRRLPGMEPIGGPRVVPEIGELIGADGEGRLVGRVDRTIVFWDLEAGTEAGRMTMPGLPSEQINDGVVVVEGRSGDLPRRIDLSAATWHERLCQLIPDPPSAAAAAVIGDRALAGSGCR